MIRCFIAVDIPEDVRALIGGVVEKVKGKIGAGGVRWVPVGNIHLTLKFLGSVEERSLPEIERRLSDICANSGPFSVAARGTGVFPGPKHPSVLWVGVDESEALNRLYREVDEAMAGLGFEKEGRKFSPHLTIGRAIARAVARVKDRRDAVPAAGELATFRDLFFGSINIEEILLMKSVLGPSGVQYSKLAGFRLGRAKKEEV
ncbi:MAG TPA: RNA 2',3'-cyclic phosphodiesterase [Dissulfurispiraceae bacterium]